MHNLVPEPALDVGAPSAIMLHRFAGNPILEPIKEHPWESKYVLNPGALRIDNKVYLIYRAMGEDGISRLGLALSRDGLEFSERLDEPIYEPVGRGEERGCEDPRLTVIGDRIFMLYTAWGGVIPQVAMASIPVDDFIHYQWDSWRRHGLVFPGLANKNAFLFPNQFDGKYLMIHRIEPYIWLTSAEQLSCPWPGNEHKVLATCFSGTAWEQKKIGAGSPPIKTRYGWLVFTHGVDFAGIYRLGVMLLDMNDPSVVLYRSPSPVLEPVERYEVGEPDRCCMPNVVFTCGAVPMGCNESLDTEDEVLVYYGAADTVICVATARIGDLIPVGH